jgi:hypothetical protein
MTGWGPSGRSYLRLVYANEPVERLVGIGARFAAAFGRLSTKLRDSADANADSDLGKR